MSTFVLWGNGPCVNRGCEAILRGTVEILSRTFEDAAFISCRAGREVPTDEELFTHPKVKHRRPIVRRLSWPWIYRAYERARGRVFRFETYSRIASAVLGLGGDNYSTDYHEMPFPYFNAIKRARARGVPFVVWGASTGQLNANFEEYGLQMLKLATLITTRETTSYAYLQEKGLTNVRLVADPAFVMPAREPIGAEQPRRLMDRFQVIGLNLSPLYGGFFPGGIAAWRECCRELIAGILAETDFAVLLIPHVFRPRDNDETFMQDVITPTFLNSERIVLLQGHSYSAEELKWVIGKVNYFIGTRTHATIAAFSQSVPTISLGYSAKAAGINKDIFGHTDWLVSADMAQPAVVLSKLRALIERRGEVIDRYVHTMPEYIERAWLAGTYLKRTLNEEQRTNLCKQ
ncbi:MAG TPA: polysaccharide pyruvyl transferase family protein [Sedimentisphaerales bacterium]|nr:polysaccharide pyruvyl transferase family protein [Sedimentisphaerales bacterium]